MPSSPSSTCHSSIDQRWGSNRVRSWSESIGCPSFSGTTLLINGCDVAAAARYWDATGIFVNAFTDVKPSHLAALSSKVSTFPTHPVAHLVRYSSGNSGVTEILKKQPVGLDSGVLGCRSRCMVVRRQNVTVRGERVGGGQGRGRTKALKNDETVGEEEVDEHGSGLGEDILHAFGHHPPLVAGSQSL